MLMFSFYILTRSSYENAPGGCTCLKKKLLQTMKDYATSFYATNTKPIEVTSIAGSSHSKTSKHYHGGVMDVRCKAPLDHCTPLKNYCR
jgi:hypothetical protein